PIRRRRRRTHRRHRRTHPEARVAATRPAGDAARATRGAWPGAAPGTPTIRMRGGSPMQNVMPVRFRRAVRDVPAAVTRDEVQPADAPATVDAGGAAPAVRHATVDAVTTVDGVDLGS